jgi:hypothetical protein
LNITRIHAELRTLHETNKLDKVGELGFGKCQGIRVAVEDAILMPNYEEIPKIVYLSILLKVLQSYSKVFSIRIGTETIPSSIEEMSVIRKSSSSPEVKFTDFWKTLATTMKEVGYEITIRIEDAKIQRGHEESLCQAIISLMEALGENVVEFRLRLPFLLSEKTYLGRENFLQKISALLKKAQGIHISTLLLSQEVAEFIEEVGDKIVALQVDQLPNSQKQFLQKVLRKTAWLENLKLLASEFEQVPEEIYKLKVLSRLTISDNENIRRIPDKICSLEELSHLSFAGCENLSNFPECLCQSCGVSNINIDETNITKIPITCGRCELSIILPNGQEVQKHQIGRHQE